MLIHDFFLLDRRHIPVTVDEKDVPYHYCKTEPGVKINDEPILQAYDGLKEMQFHWHYYGNLHFGLAYHGITIIPNEALADFYVILDSLHDRSFEKLKNLCVQAMRTKKDIVHFGI